MSLTSNNVKISGVPKFNGDPSKFSYFSMKFKALIMRLGPKYVKALNRTAPYDLLEAEVIAQQIEPPPELSAEQVQALSEEERTEYKRQVVGFIYIYIYIYIYSLKSLWLDGFEKLFLLRNVTDLYIYIYNSVTLRNSMFSK